jgi:lipid II:glycine glycyltransferase (peptidoglycan interpeptide bridge formation enzyme)
MVYLLGATSPEALTVKAAYLLQWKAIEEARARGCRWYDLGGIDPAENPGVFHFKEGLGGADVTAAGPFEWRSGARARLTVTLESRYRAFRARREAAAAASASAT